MSATLVYINLKYSALYVIIHKVIWNSTSFILVRRKSVSGRTLRSPLDELIWYAAGSSKGIK